MVTTTTHFWRSRERQHWAWSNAAWPNIITLDVLRDGESLDTGIQTINIGEGLELTCTYNDYDSSSTVRVYADQDCNPYNDNNLGLIACKIFPLLLGYGRIINPMANNIIIR
jgi:hypothetical protein